MGDEGGLEPDAEQHRCNDRCDHPVRCIICNRLKRPRGAVVPAQLTGMRCDERCPGYHLDPPVGHLWPVFTPHRTGAVVDSLVGTAVGGPQPAVDRAPPGNNTMTVMASDDSIELLAWALHQAHPPARHRAARQTVTYRLACLLMGDEVGVVVTRLVGAGCAVRQVCVALGSVVLEVSGDPVVIIAEIDRWDGGGIQIVPPPPAGVRTPPRGG